VATASEAAPSRGRRGRLGGALVALALAHGACAAIVVPRVDPSPPVPTGVFVAGVAKVDITPPPGVPLFGYSSAGRHVGAGVRTRLYARALYLEDGAGERVALVQCDLGAVSTLLHRSVARAIADVTGVSTDRLLVAATHTHSGPGGFFGTALYDNWGATHGGFDRRMLDFLVERLARAVREAYRTRQPAALAIDQAPVYSLTRNRSVEAHLRNRVRLAGGMPPFPLPPEYEAVDPVLTLLRVDRLAGARTEPLGAFTTFAIHGTVLSPANDLYNADVHAAAERVVEWEIRRHYRTEHEVIHALANGSEGDVQPAFTTQGFPEAERLGRALGAHAFARFRFLDGRLGARVAIARNYAEIALEGARVVDGVELCARGALGAPVIGGSEDSRTGFFHLAQLVPFLSSYEGARRSAPKGCQGTKRKALGAVQRVLLPVWAFPRRLTLQTIRVNDLVLVAVPGELTTEMGARVKAAVLASARRSGQAVSRVAIVGLANQYASYFTTPEEYEAQHYEGASTLFGPASGPLLAERAATLVAAMAAPARPEVPEAWRFRSGFERRLMPDDSAPPSLAREARQVSVRCEEARPTARFVWSDLPPGAIELDAPLVRIDIEDGQRRWGPHAETGIPVDDRGLDVEIRLLADGGLWQATWYALAPLPGRALRFAIAPRKGLPELASASFALVCP
jgi:neutral ceramidase